MHMCKCVCKGNPDSNRIRPRQRNSQLVASRKYLPEVSSFDVLHDRVGALLFVSGSFQYLGHPRMLELRLDARLIQKAGSKALVALVLSPDFLHHACAFGAFDTTRRRQVDFTHPTASYPTKERQPAESTRQSLAQVVRGNLFFF